MTGVVLADKPKKETKKNFAFMQNLLKRMPKWSYPLIFGGAVTATGVVYEANHSYAQHYLFQDTAANQNIQMTDDLNAAEISAPTGPYNKRHGYTERQTIRDNMANSGFSHTEKATGTEPTWLDGRFQTYPIYQEKNQIGLTLTDMSGDVVFQTMYPKQAYQSFNDIPDLLIQSLCYVENRDICSKETDPQKNPTIEWSRFSQAAYNQILKKMGLSDDGSGGSTLATQLEKLRHSEGGVTKSADEKLKQMATASAKAYQDGADTSAQRERIILDYINAMPLAAFPKFGEVVGFADGMSLWFGADFNKVNELLSTPQENLSDAELKPIAKAYRQALTLIMAVKQPTDFLIKDRAAMQERMDGFISIMANDGIISERFAKMVAETDITFEKTLHTDYQEHDTLKSTDTMRITLMEQMGYDDLNQMEMFDIQAQSTIDATTNRAVEALLHQFKDPEADITQNLMGYRLAKPHNVNQIEYAITMYQRTDDANLLRIQADTFSGQFNLNANAKLELGSTAKLRTLVTYLEIIAELHTELSQKPVNELQAMHFNPDDKLSIWVRDYLAQDDETIDKDLKSTLNAAMEREYSGSNRELFFTGGSYHRFENFKRQDNYRTMPLRSALQRSVNLPFIRVMQDIVNYTLYHDMDISPEIYDDMQHPERRQHLEDFADKESALYLWRYWRQMSDKSQDDITQMMVEKTQKTQPHLAVIYRNNHPERSVSDFKDFLADYGHTDLDIMDAVELYDQYAPGQYPDKDLAYITGTHDLEIWLARHLNKNPSDSWANVKEQSGQARMDAYQWLFKSRNKWAQDKRIRTIIEEKAFNQFIHPRWEKQGFPFDKMVASYASSIGVSGDNPDSLADLAGIIMNGGERNTISSFNNISVAEGTPYADRFKDNYEPAQYVLKPEIADLVLAEIQNVVAKGTARRAHKSAKTSDGRILPVGGKTGTGDNRKIHRNKDGSKESLAVNRTATFMFTIDDCMYGTIIAYAPGEMSDSHKFTSALPVQAFKELMPTLQPLFDQACKVKPEDKAPQIAEKANDDAQPAAASKKPKII